jgi:hypothetical protein
MHQPAPSMARTLALIGLLVSLFAGSVPSENHPITIRLAGEAWFLDSLTNSGMIPVFERQSGTRVEVVHKDDRNIMSGLDRGPNLGRRWAGADCSATPVARHTGSKGADSVD